MTLKKTLFILIVLAVLGLLGLQIYKKVTAEGKGFAGQRRNPAVAIETKPVRRDTILDIGHFTGTLHARSQFVIAPKIGGRLEKLLVDVGDHVREDQLIAVLDKDEYVQQVEQSRAELEVIRAQLEESRSAQEIAGREMERVTALRKKEDRLRIGAG